MVAEHEKMAEREANEALREKLRQLAVEVD
jgi:hypothetical protein